MPVGGRACCLGAALLVSCVAPRTEVLVEVTTDLGVGVGQALASVVLTVRSGDRRGESRLQQVIPLGGTQAGRRTLPLSFGVVPIGGDDRHLVWIEVRGCADVSGCSDGGPAVVTQRATVGFVPEATVVLRLPLSAGCRAILCADGQTCCGDTGRCVGERVNERLLPREGAVVDGGVVCERR